MNINFGNGTSNLMNTKVRRQKFGIGGLSLLTFIGIIFTVIGILGINSTKINASWKRIDGTVASYNVSASINNSTTTSSNSTTYPAVVTYMVNSQSYTVTSSTSSSSRPTIGSTKQVAYNPQNPADAKVVAGKSAAILYIFPVVGIILLLLGPLLFVRSIRRSKDIGNLQQTGQKLQGVISNIASVGSTNNTTNYKIVVSATDPSGTMQYYTSDSLSGVGGLAMANFQTTPIPMDVYVNPSNPKDYYVDISDVPNLTPERIKDMIMQASGQPAVPSQAPIQTPPPPPINPVQ